MAAAGIAAEALVLGLSSGPVCLASCSPVLLPVLAAEQRSPRGTGVLLAEFLAGRLGGYLGFACLAWLVGLSLPLQPRTRALAFGFSDLAMAALLAGYALALRHKPNAGCEQACPAARARSFVGRFGIFAPLCLGFATGISLCPPFVAAGVRAAQSTGLASAVLFFSCFFLGTSVWFAPSVGLALLRRFTTVGVVARLVLFLLAGYYGYLTLIILGGLLFHG